MPAGRIYCQVSLKEGLSISLPRDASHYVSRVLRLKVGERVVIFNGDGGEYEAKIDHLKKDQVALTVTHYVAINHESHLKIQLGLGLLRGDRMDVAIQKAVELGVDSITPVLSERTNIKVSGERLEKRVTHWQGVAVHACEQSGRCVVPVVHPPLPLLELVEQQPFPGFVANPWTSEKLPASYDEASVTVLVGPEGGFSTNEIDQLHAMRWRSFSMGKRILRAETAAIMAVACLQWRWGDL